MCSSSDCLQTRQGSAIASRGAGVAASNLGKCAHHTWALDHLLPDSSGCKHSKVDQHRSKKESTFDILEAPNFQNVFENSTRLIFGDALKSTYSSSKEKLGSLRRKPAASGLRPLYYLYPFWFQLGDLSPFFRAHGCFSPAD
eukprot:1161808-Pelagomonas_calceolata.AAC.5